MKMNKKLLISAVGAVAGGGALYYAGTQIDQTDYATKDPDGAYKAKLAGGAAAAVVGAVLLAYGKTIPGAILLAGGGGMAAEAYHVHSAMPPKTTPSVSGSVSGSKASANVDVGTAVQAAVDKALGGTPGDFKMPSGGLPQQQSGASIRMLPQSGAAMRVGMAQSGAAMRVGMWR